MDEIIKAQKVQLEIEVQKDSRELTESNMQKDFYRLSFICHTLQ